MQYQFHAQPMITYADGCSAMVGKMLKKYGVPEGAAVLLVHGNNVKASGLVDGIEQALRAEAYALIPFNRVESDAPVEIIREGTAFARDNKVSAVVAIGGGSCLDIAKAIAVMLSNDGDILNYVGMDAVPNCRKVIFAAIPTTCGTGSEVTDGGVVYDTEHNVKLPFWDGFAAPDIALLDPLLLLKLPKKLIAQTALDAMAHSVEAFTSAAASPMADALALGAVEIIVNQLPAAYEKEDNKEELGMLLSASTMAGIAFNRNSVHFGHSIAHAVGALAHIHHGAACALALPLILREECRALPDKMKKLAAVFGIQNCEELSGEELGERLQKRMEDFTAAFGIKSFGDYGVTGEHIETALAYIAQDPITQMSAQQIPLDVIKEYLESKI